MVMKIKGGPLQRRKGKRKGRGRKREGKKEE
jgi:hypothetical protein